MARLLVNIDVDDLEKAIRFYTEARHYQRHWTPVHLDFAVDDLEPAVRRAQVAGARVEDAITEHAWGCMALLSDPFGHGFCLLQFKGRGYDEVASHGADAAIDAK